MEKYEDFTYDELLSKKAELSKKYKEDEDECIKKSMEWDDACDTLRPTAIELYIVDKYLRLKKEPVMTFGKKWKGSLIELEKFKEMAKNGQISDSANIGYYATEKGQSDIEIHPSDVIEDKVRDDFYYVILYKK